MSDNKDDYSDASGRYVEGATGEGANPADKKAYGDSKDRESRHNDNWKKQSVNFNEICDEFAPGARGERRGQKFIVMGDRYVVQADMASGYVRIWDKVLKSHVRLDGTPSKKDVETHFKIKRREEM